MRASPGRSGWRHSTKPGRPVWHETCCSSWRTPTDARRLRARRRPEFRGRPLRRWEDAPGPLRRAFFFPALKNLAARIQSCFSLNPRPGRPFLLSRAWMPAQVPELAPGGRRNRGNPRGPCAGRQENRKSQIARTATPKGRRSKPRRLFCLQRRNRNGIREWQTVTTVAEYWPPHERS